MDLYTSFGEIRSASVLYQKSDVAIHNLLTEKKNIFLFHVIFSVFCVEEQHLQTDTFLTVKCK